MELSANTRVTDLIAAYPFLANFMAASTLAEGATLADIASAAGVDLDAILSGIARRVWDESGESLTINRLAGNAAPAGRAETLRSIIRDLHAGASKREIKTRFRDLIKDVSPEEVAAMEQSLIAEGMPESEIKSMCDVHVEIFRESLQGNAPRIDVPEGHVILDLMAENRAAESVADEVLAAWAHADGASAPAPRHIDGLLQTLARIDLHYVKKENELFPMLERLGISGPPKVMWGHHDDIRGLIKSARARLAAGDAARAEGSAKDAVFKIREMIFKEENILFPMALGRLTDGDWEAVRRGCREIGYAWIAPADAGEEAVPSETSADGGFGGDLSLMTGRLPLETLNLMLSHLPFDLSFVDEHDRVRFYSEGKDRIFPRSPGVIGRSVQNCHPPKSVHMVNEILDRFRAGERDVAEFWLELGGRFLHIRYFAVRDGQGTYKGCLETMQDVTAIRALTGQRRLLEWD